jgi:predicted aconitase with swiveling domain
VGRQLSGRAVIPGEATGTVLISRVPISLWGGVDPETGKIIDPHHDRCGESIVDRVFAFPGEKGSSTGSAVLLELVGRGLAPAALITTSLAPIAALGSIVAEELYGRTVPMTLISPDAMQTLREGDRLSVRADGTLHVS